MKTQYVSFDYWFGQDNKLEIGAEVQAVIPATGPDLKGPGTPAEGGEVEITSCRLVDQDGNGVDFDPEGLFIRPWGKVETSSLVEDIERTAGERADENGWGC